MTAGDIKGDQVETTVVTLGATTAVGQVVHIEADGKWDPVANGDAGTFGVALDAGGEDATARVVILGRMEVTNGSTTAIPIGAPVMSYTGGTVMLSDWGSTKSVGVATEAIAGSATGTVFVGI